MLDITISKLVHKKSREKNKFEKFVAQKSNRALTGSFLVNNVSSKDPFANFIMFPRKKIFYSFFDIFVNKKLKQY